MRRKIVAGNWKMNGGIAFASAYLAQFSGLQKSIPDGVDVFIAPPSVLYATLLDGLKASRVTLAGQNVSAYESGAYTGEVSAAMLAEVGCSWCLVGHSERRQLFGETDEEVAEKVQRLLASDIRPVLCVGETLEQRESGETFDLIQKQVSRVLDQLTEEQMLKLVIAYEPVWAIGTGLTASPEQAQEVHRFIRQQVAGYCENAAAIMPILYGGSVNSGNAAGLFEQEDIDGGLVGGASLKADEFAQICAVAG